MFLAKLELIAICLTGNWCRGEVDFSKEKGRLFNAYESVILSCKDPSCYRGFLLNQNLPGITEVSFGIESELGKKVEREQQNLFYAVHGGNVLTNIAATLFYLKVLFCSSSMPSMLFSCLMLSWDSDIYPYNECTKNICWDLPTCPLKQQLIS